MIRDTSAQDTVIKPASAWRRRWPWAAGAAALAALLVWGWPMLSRALSAGNSFSQARLTLSAVERGELVRDVAGEGKVVAAASPTLYAGNAGIVSLLVQAGDAVKRNQVLVRITSAELSAKLAQERSNADALKSEALRAEADARQQRASAQALLDTATIQHKTAVNDLARQTQAFQAGAAAGMQVDQARDAVARAEVALKQAQEGLTLKDDAMRFELQAKRQAYERQLLQVKDIERQQAELEVRSPVDGQVGQLFVTERSSIARDAKLLSVVDLSQLEVQMQVAESFARELQPGMPGEISGNGQVWKGRIGSVSPEVVNGEVSARLRFDGNQPEQLRQSQRLSVRVLLDKKSNVLVLTRGSFVDEGGGRIVYVLRDGYAERRNVRLGAMSLSKVEVLEGLQPGERVVTSGADNFKGAERVVITP